MHVCGLYAFIALRAQKMPLNPLELKLQMVVSQVLGTEPGS